MYLIFYITAIIILVYMLYPLFLMALPAKRKDPLPGTPYDPKVSLILLSFNGMKYLEDKIHFLLNELSAFSDYELIIIDDHSSDGSREYLENYTGRQGIKTILNTEHKGIPYAMNLGVATARNDIIIFCDQRQKMMDGILQQLVQPLADENVGAVSACISSLDKENSRSAIRKYENFIKARESRCGCLIGVYGPCYAIRKEEYMAIPKDVILDDLYLSLRILRSRAVILQEKCMIIDKNISQLYTVSRARRYLAGFWQILKDREIRKSLNARQHVMLMWHKYLRLLIPVFIALSYINLVVLAFTGPAYLVIFLALTLAGIFILLSKFPAAYNGLRCLLKVNIYYLAGLIAILFQKNTSNIHPPVNNRFDMGSENKAEQLL